MSLGGAQLGTRPSPADRRCAVHVTVDEDRCQGHARCYLICPEVFDLDDQGHAVVLVAEVPEELAERVAEAQRNCPEQAISVTAGAGRA
jgi:ferredoxin